MNENDQPNNFAEQSSFQKQPATGRTARRQYVSQSEMFETQYTPLESRQFFQVVDATLKRPAQVVHELVCGKDIRIPIFLLLVLLACLAGTGLMMGSFSGGSQLLAVPLKIVVGTLVSCAICIPSLYILLCLCGGEQNLAQICRLLLFGLTLAGILMVGFLPVAWIFSQATEALAFMGVLYIFIWAIGLYFGLRLMSNAVEFLNGKSMGALRLWVVVFSLVLLQMSTSLRPLIGQYEPLKFNEKMFFIEHWINR